MKKNLPTWLMVMMKLMKLIKPMKLMKPNQENLIALPVGKDHGKMKKVCTSWHWYIMINVVIIKDQKKETPKKQSFKDTHYEMYEY